MKHCLLCSNLGKHCTCEHCENYECFKISKEGKSMINQVQKDLAKEVLNELAERKERVKSFYSVAESVGVDIAINTIKEMLKQKGVEVE